MEKTLENRPKAFDGVQHLRARTLRSSCSAKVHSITPTERHDFRFRTNFKLKLGRFNTHFFVSLAKQDFRQNTREILSVPVVLQCRDNAFRFVERHQQGNRLARFSIDLKECDVRHGQS